MEINQSFWTLVKSNLKNRNKDNPLIASWIDPIYFVEQKGTLKCPKIVLGVPSPIHQYFAVENVLEKIYLEISPLLQSEFEVDIVVKSHPQPVQESLFSESSTQDEEMARFLEMKNTTQQPQFPSQNSSNSQNRSDVLNPDYTFSTFVVGRNTEFAHAASYNVAQNPSSDGYNPLFICGPVGMGKTHLLHAVGNHIKSTFSGVKIMYVSAEKFLNDCISSIRRHEMDKFRQKYRENCDVLLVDDVQYIGKGEATQEEFFHTINSFIEKKKQVIVASDRMPKDILGLEDRSRSRLEWGLIADISMPDLETRVAILRYKAEKMGLRLNDEVVSYVGRISKRSIRELEGNLKKIKMFSELQGLPISIDLAKKVLLAHETHTTISIEEIQKMVADHFKVRIADLKATTRAKQIVVPRQVAMYLIKKHLDKSLVDIGRAFGGKDHTTVMNALERVDYLQTKDLDIKNDIEELTTRIHNITGV